MLWSDEATDTAHQMAATSTVTVNTTLNQTINLTAQWGTADTDNAITMTNLVVEALM
ncbi:MAG: hypothetical protein IPK52_26175 [Chloroflexi bacterium]|nr:hypothetical protein [Chloroflexota bacterium]